MTEQKKVQTMKGLTDEEVRMARNKYGKNELIPTKKESLFLKPVGQYIVLQVFFIYL